jgi:hypothetical protein
VSVLSVRCEYGVVGQRDRVAHIDDVGHESLQADDVCDEVIAANVTSPLNAAKPLRA